MTDKLQEPLVDDAAPPAGDVTPAETPIVDDAGGDGPSPLAAGDDPKKAPEPAKQPEPAKEPELDWREEWAKKAANGDEKAAKRHLKTLERFKNQSDVFGSFNELRAYISEGGLVKVPGKDATDDEIASFRKAMNVPDEPAGYLENLKLDNDAVLGDADKPIVESFAAALHETNAPPEVVNQAVNWYFRQQEAIAEQRDEDDDAFKTQSTAELKEELGGAYKRSLNAISANFSMAPGGPDIENESALYPRLLAARYPDGRLVGNDPDFIRWQVALAREINPTMTVMDGSDGGSRSIDAEISDIENLMRTDRRAYNKDVAKQARYRELLDARQKAQQRA